MKLKRTNIYLGEKQLKALRREAAQKEVPSVAELIRRIVDEHLAAQEKRNAA